MLCLEFRNVAKTPMSSLSQNNRIKDISASCIVLPVRRLGGHKTLGGDRIAGG